MKTKSILALSALMLIAMATAAMAQPSANLAIDRPTMRDIRITWTSLDGAAASCVVTQRLTIFSPWTQMKAFSLASGATFVINMDNTMPIYSEQKVECVSGSTDILTTSTYKMFGGSSVVQNCPVIQSCTEQGYIRSSDCPTGEACNTNTQYCQTNSDCCSNNCYSTHKCVPTGCYSHNAVCVHDSDCCSNDCEDNSYCDSGHWHSGHCDTGHWHEVHKCD